MKPSRSSIIGALYAAFGASQAAAGNYDGSWTAIVAPQGSCRSTAIMTLTLSGNSFQGQTRYPTHTDAFSGKIDADGKGTFLVYPRFAGIIKFSSDHFEADWNTDHCRLHSIGDRAMTSEEVTAAYAIRKDRQARYEDLSARAAAGDKSVAFTELRAAYPYTDQWDPFGNKTAALLDEARGAATGKDCATALAKLDEVLRLDFTIDAAHALKSDCLAATGRRAAATIEAAIADGLVRSLMESGDGSTEKSAYVVMTEREELDVLANRHLVFKARQTEILGSDGRIFDEVQGAAPRADDTTKTLFFDVSSLVNGRKSRLAAIDSLASTMP